MIGYGLFAVALSMATLLFVYIANGYYIDSSTGQVIQNGLVYVDSKPVSAEVWIDGEKQNVQTDSRHVIPSGPHTISLRADGYRDWSRSFDLKGSSLLQLTYARLIPDQITVTSGASLRADPYSVLQSIDRRWMIASHETNPLVLSLLDTADPSQTTSEDLIIDEDVLLKPSDDAQIELLEWDGSHRYILARYTAQDSVEYLLLDRAADEQTLNLTALGEQYDFYMQDRDIDTYFAYDRDEQTVHRASQTNVSATPLLSGVIDFVAFEDNWIVYVVESDTAGMVEARFMNGDDDILLKELAAADSYHLQLAKLDSSPIIALASSDDDRVSVYRDPQAQLRDMPELDIPAPATVFRLQDVQDVRISSDSSLVMAYSGADVVSYEFETETPYRFTVDAAFDDGQELQWIDGQHVVYVSNNMYHSLDFDGSNSYQLFESAAAGMPVYASDSVEELFSFQLANQPEDSSVRQLPQLQVASLLAQ